MAVTPPPRLSPTSWSQWDTCKYAWYLRYIEKLPQTTGVAAEAGKFVHAVLDKLMGDPPGERCIERARDLAHETPLPFELVDLGGSPREFKRATWHAIRGLWELEDPTRVAVVAREKRHEFTLAGVPMTVIVDREDRQLDPYGIVVTDYKTGKLDAKYRLPKERRQIHLSVAAVAAEHGEEQTARLGRLYYLNEDSVEFVSSPLEARQALAFQAAETWVDIRTACAKEDFPPSPGPLCQWCDWAAQCDEGTAWIRRAEIYGWRNKTTGKPVYRPDAPGSMAVRAADAA